MMPVFKKSRGGLTLFYKAIAVMLVVVMSFGALPVAAMAGETPVDQVRVIVENTTYSVADGAPWDGTLVDTWVDIDSDSTMMGAVVDALDTIGATQEGAESNYIYSVNGLDAFDGGYESGWMGTLNDWFTNEGFGAFTVADGTLEAGDEIRIMYTCDLGVDLGGNWDNNDKTVKALSFSAGELSPEFAKDTHDYTLTVPQGTTGVVITPTASNKNFQVRTSVGDTDYKRSATVPVADGTMITVKCGDPAWPSMNNQAGGTGASVPAEVYTIAVTEQVDPYIVITHDSAGGKVQEYSYLDNKDRILVYDCACDELETTFKATAYPEGSGEVEFQNRSTSFYSFEAETGVLKLTSKADGETVRGTITATLKEDPTVTTTEIIAFRRSLKQTAPEKVEIELPEDGSDYTYTLDVGKTYKNYGGMSWEFPENDYFTGTTASPYLWNAQITPKRPGTADIYATDVLTETRVKVQVTVTGVAVVTEDGGRAEAKLAGNGNPAENLQLLAYSGLAEDTFIWTSDDESIAAVDQNGLVTPKKVGAVMIRAQSDGSGKSAGIKVLVRADGAPYLDDLIFAPGTNSTEKFVNPLAFEPTVLEYPDLLCPEGSASKYYGGLYVFPTFESENIEAALLYTDADGKMVEAVLSSGSQTVINDCLQAGENEITINLTEKSSGQVTIYKFTVIRPLSLVNTIDYASLKPVHREAADYPQFILPVELDKPLTTLTREGEIYHAYSSVGLLTPLLQKDNYTAVLNDVEAIDISFTKSMPQESVIRMRNQASGEIYTEDQFGNIPLNENGDTVFDIEVMSGKTAAANPGEFIAENTSYTLTVYKLDMPPVDMSGVYFNSATFSDGCILTTPPVGFDPQTTTSVKLLIPNQGDSWVDVTLPEDAELYLGSVLPENKVTASEGVYRIPLEPDSVTAILALEVDGYLCEKHYTFDIMRRGTLATPDRVVDYLCAPSQYTNGIGGYGGSPEATLLGSGTSTYASVKSLGNFGGYITYYYEDAINNSPNNPYGVDFIVYGNSVDGGQGFSEPGNVLVSQDGATWYSLAGSDHFDDNVIWNYPVTYIKQPDGQAGYSHANGSGVWRQYPDWNNYPLTENRGDSFTLTGSLITDEGAKDAYGSPAAPYPDWGYADVSLNGTVDGNASNPYDKGAYRANGFDLDWAVDADGQPVKLDSVNYVKVETASFIIAGAIGEKSTEVNCVVKANASASEVGVTPAPQSITVNGKAVNLEAGVNSYDVKLDSLNSAFTVAVDAPEGSNIYINSQRGASREFEKAPREKIVRVIVQEGEKEPAIYYLNLSEKQPEPGVTRIAGNNRYDTSAQTALQAYPEGAKAVIIARGDDQGDFSDALAASYLAGVENAPILLTASGSLPQEIVDAIQQLGATKAYVLGGELAVSQGVVSKLKTLGLETERIQGQNRYATAAAIAAKGGPAETAIIVSSTAPADSLVAGPLAFSSKCPILLVDKNSVPAETKQAIADLGITKIIVIGGENVVSQTVYNELKAQERYDGHSRIETSLAVAGKAFKDAKDFSIVGYLKLADAVGAAVNGDPIIYVKDNLADVQNYLTGATTAGTSFNIFGGPLAVNSTVENELKGLLK